jgi:hypothetical protein
LAVDEAEVDASTVPEVLDADETRSDIMTVQESKPATRSRRKPAVPKRRGSSASESSTTSISVSIATNKKPRNTETTQVFQQEENREANADASPPQRSGEKGDPLPATTEKERSHEKPMELSAPPELTMPPDEPMELESTSEESKRADEEPTELVGETKDIVSIVAKEHPSPRPAQPSAELGATGGSQGARLVGDAAKKASTPSLAIDSSIVIDVTVQSLADSKPPVLPEPPEPLPERNTPPPPASRSADPPVPNATKPPREEEKEEGELSEDG